MNTDKTGLLSDNLIFKRKFCINEFKTLRMPLMRMDFYRDWIKEEGGDPYPLLSDEKFLPRESVDNCAYTAFTDGEKAFSERLIGGHFPYATYKVTVVDMDDGAEAGFSLVNTKAVLRFFLRNSKNGEVTAFAQEFINGDMVSEQSQKLGSDFVGEMNFNVTCGRGAFSVFVKNKNRKEDLFVFVCKELNYADENVFTNTAAALYTSVKHGASVTVKNVCACLDCGEAQADIRTIRYEDGTPIITDGRVYFTLTVRDKAGGYQAVVSLNPSFCDLRLEGGIFFGYGDGCWYSDIASSVIYNRKTDEWYVWAVSFTHDHMLIKGKTENDLLHGINLVPVEKMNPVGDDCNLSEEEKDKLFMGKFGDEDPDFIYDEKTDKWYLTVCRTVDCGDRTRYRYFLFESDDPFDGYRFRDKTVTGSDTGGSIVRVGEELYFVCGSDGSLRANYHAYPLFDLSKCKKMRFDYDDGGFRGWGTIVPLSFGNRTRLLWLTFDRHNSDPKNRWSYGNLYAFEAFI